MQTMMKTIFKTIIAIAAATALLCSCSKDKLDIEQQGVMGVNTYKTADNDGVLSFIAAVYAEVLGDGYQAVLGAGPACYRSYLYELTRMGGESSDYYAYNESADAKTYSNIWSYFYRTIYWCNMIIENLPDNDVADADVVNQVVAEARAIRAISMMHLVQLFGNPPLADHILDGTEGNTPASESWEFINSELAEAAEALPSKGAKGAQASIGGRLTKEAAYAYLGKAYLWQKDYDNAAKTLYNKVIATGYYALQDDWASLNSSSSDFCDENIWEFDFSSDGSVSTSQEGCFDIACFAPNISMWLTTFASPMMAFGMGANPSSGFAAFMSTHEYKDFDMTTYSMIMTSRYDQTLADLYKVSCTYMGMVTLPISECEGYFKIKNLTLAEDLTGDFPFYYTVKNAVYMRYAEVLLNYAEAVAQGGSAGSLSGLQALNLVRTRAGLGEAPELVMDNETYGVKQERRAELAFEGCRFIDLVRWGDAATELKDCGKLRYTLEGTPSYQYPLTETMNLDMYFPGSWSTTTSETGGPGFVAGKNELFPIPSSDVNSNSNLTQNPGW